MVLRFVGDHGMLQTEDPAAPDYVTAHTSTGARIALSYHNTGHQRPWFKALTARLHGGYLREGDTITIVFGDPAHGSPGMRMQTFCESGFEFKVLADVCAVGHYVPLPETPAIAIVPGHRMFGGRCCPPCVARVSVFTSVSNARIYGATRPIWRPAGFACKAPCRWPICQARWTTAPAPRR